MAIKQRPDSPTNNFATFNPLDIGTSDEVFREGNTFRRSGDSYGNYDIGKTNFIIPKTGKWYAEFCLVGQRATDPPASYFGILKSTAIPAGDSPHPDNGYFISKGTSDNTPYKYDGITPSNSAMSDSISTPLGFIAQVFFDADNNKIWFGLNNTWLESGNPSAGTGHIYTTSTAYDWVFSAGRQTNDGGRWSEVACNFGQDPTFGGNKTPSGGTNSDGSYPDKSTSGIGGFFYEPPAGALALCTANLPEMTPTVDDDTPQDYFKAVIWTNPTTDTDVTVPLEFQADLLWWKQRDVSNSHRIQDTVRGLGNVLSSNHNGANSSLDVNTQKYNVKTVTSTGFTFNGYIDTTTRGGTMVAWCWQAGGNSNTFNINGNGYSTYSALQTANTSLPASSTSGMIVPSGMSINTDAGFSIVKYTGTGANRTVPHGLSSAPEVILAKDLDAIQQWHCGFTEIGWGRHIHLDLPNAQSADGSSAWNSTAPAPFFFSLGGNSGTNANGNDYIAYCWHSVEGYSKFGSYTGNGSADGPFVYCGFRPAFVMWKRTDTTSDWFMMDNARDIDNPTDHKLEANSSGSEVISTTYYTDYLSNGFKLRNTNAQLNATNGTYIFMAFAEQPFNYANAR